MRQEEADRGAARPSRERPLRLGEVLAEAVRLYGERIWAALGLGSVTVASFLVTLFAHPVVDVAAVSVGFTLSYALGARLAAGDPFREAWAHVARRPAVLLVLSVVASLPFALAASQLVLLAFAVGWLTAVGFSIPVAVLERDAERHASVETLGYALRRSVALARAEFLHAAGVIAALVLVFILGGFLLGGALVGFADSGELVARALVQLVLAPFFFFGLAVLYFEQRARALSSPR